jgi:UDP-3-O-[3-hydroxymyristoyl] glucosamine N-acyltransferase
MEHPSIASQTIPSGVGFGSVESGHVKLAQVYGAVVGTTVVVGAGVVVMSKVVVATVVGQGVVVVGMTQH